MYLARYLPHSRHSAGWLHRVAGKGPEGRVVGKCRRRINGLLLDRDRLADAQPPPATWPRSRFPGSAEKRFAECRMQNDPVATCLWLASKNNVRGGSHNANGMCLYIHRGLRVALMKSSIQAGQCVLRT